MAIHHTPYDILDFWFSSRVSNLWFNSNPEFDRELNDKFEPLFKRASAGELSDWQQTPEGALALVIALDQFPLNLYRGRAESYSTGDLAVAAANHAIAQGFDRRLPATQLAFLYMPFMHSESIADQDRSVELFEKAGLADNMRFAQHHRELIQRFGRFPHRNAALARVNTPDEEAYLATKGAFRG
ncbi:MAG: DUF924 family protein [Bdellovibrionota bacterium]